MARHYSSLTGAALALLVLPLALTACGRADEEKAENNRGTMNASEAAEALDEAMNEQDGAVPEAVVPPPAPANEKQLIPAGFQGRWSASAAGCARQGDDSRLFVRGDTLVFYESAGKVRSVQQLSADEIKVTVDYDGEGESWSRTSTMRLAKDTLTVEGMKRVRCS